MHVRVSSSVFACYIVGIGELLGGLLFFLFILCRNDNNNWAGVNLLKAFRMQVEKIFKEEYNATFFWTIC